MLYTGGKKRNGAVHLLDLKQRGMRLLHKKMTMVIRVWIFAVLVSLSGLGLGCSDEENKEVQVEEEEEEESEEDDEAEEDEEDDEDKGEAMERLSEFDKRAEVIWDRLKSYEKTYTARWGSVFRLERRYASDLIDCWNDLAYATSGPDGLWRTTVPSVWLNCIKKPEQKVCQNLKAHEAVFNEWDVFQERVSRTEPRRGGSLLLEHIDDIEQHMDTYVMESPTPEAMMKTRFYREVLAK